MAGWPTLCKFRTDRWEKVYSSVRYSFLPWVVVCVCIFLFIYGISNSTVTIFTPCLLCYHLHVFPPFPMNEISRVIKFSRLNEIFGCEWNFIVWMKFSRVCILWRSLCQIRLKSYGWLIQFSPHSRQPWRRGWCHWGSPPSPATSTSGSWRRPLDLM